jgi:RNA polymerase sigma-70 factor (ECF subfamily)
VGQGRDEDDSGIEDDRLRLMFTCCHPALPVEAQVGLTLRTLAGLTTPEIVRAFLVPQETMAKRLTRAKKKIVEARIPYRVPAAHRLQERLRAVLAVIYALFNEGYGASAGDELIRRELCTEAIRLGRLLAEMMPDESEALGLLSLMLLQDSRRGARIDAAGELVTLEEQDRDLCDGEAIDEACRVLDRAVRLRRPGPYQLQAAIAACHAQARIAADTDWREIAILYQRLSEMAPTPVVLLNRAVAVAMADGPAAGLSLVDELERTGALSGYYLLPATRADLLRRLGRFPRELAPRLCDFMSGLCRHAGFEPVVRGESFHSGWELQVLADVDVVALAPACVALDLPGGIAAAVITDPPDQLKTAIVWRKDDPSAVNREFRDAAEVVFSDSPPAPITAVERR